MLFSFKTMGKSSLLFLAVSVLQNKWKTKFYLSPPFFSLILIMIWSVTQIRGMIRTVSFVFMLTPLVFRQTPVFICLAKTGRILSVF